MINEEARIVIFNPSKENKEIVYIGFLYDGKIIYSCCGSVVDVAEVEIVEVLDKWYSLEEYLEGLYSD